MTKDEARQHLSNLSEHKATRLYLASFKSTSLAIDDTLVKLYELANEARKVLGTHRLQQSYENLIKVYPTMTKEYYDKKRKEENIT